MTEFLEDSLFAGVTISLLAYILGSVSYTHLTLPTKRIVEISVDAGSLTKKKK